METQPLYKGDTRGATEVSCLPRAPCGDTFLKTSKHDLERAERALLHYLRPVVLRDAQPGDTVFVFTPGAKTVCGSRLMFSHTSIAVTMKGVGLLDASAWPFNIVFPRKTVFFFALQLLMSLAFLCFQGIWFTVFLLDKVNDFPVMTYSNGFEEFLAITSFIIASIDFGASIFLTLMVAVLFLSLVIALFMKNRGGVYRIIEIARRLSTIWTLLLRWFLLALPLSNMVIFWIANILSALGVVFLISVSVWLSAEVDDWTSISFAVLIGSARIITDLVTALYAGSESADIPRTEMSRFCRQFCCDLFVPAVKKAHDIEKSAHH